MRRNQPIGNEVAFTTFNSYLRKYANRPVHIITPKQNFGVTPLNQSVPSSTTLKRADYATGKALFDLDCSLRLKDGRRIREWN